MRRLPGLTEVLQDVPDKCTADCGTQEPYHQWPTALPKARCCGDSTNGGKAIEWGGARWKTWTKRDADQHEKEGRDERAEPDRDTSAFAHGLCSMFYHFLPRKNANIA